MLSVYKSQQYAKMNAPRFVHEHTKSAVSSNTTDNSTTPTKSLSKSPSKQLSSSSSSIAAMSHHLSPLGEQIPPEALNVPLKKTHIQNYKSVTTKVRVRENLLRVIVEAIKHHCTHPLTQHSPHTINQPLYPPITHSITSFLNITTPPLCRKYFYTISYNLSISTPPPSH